MLRTPSFFVKLMLIPLISKPNKAYIKVFGVKHKQLKINYMQTNHGIGTHYIQHYTKEKGSIDLYNSLKEELSVLYSYVEGKNRVNVLRATYPQLSFELRPMGD